MKRLLFIFAILFFQVYKSYGQVLCGTPAITNNENARKLSSPQKRSVNSNYILTVYFHVIRTSLEQEALRLQMLQVHLTDLIRTSIVMGYLSTGMGILNILTTTPIIMVPLTRLFLM